MKKLISGKTIILEIQIRVHRNSKKKKEKIRSSKFNEQKIQIKIENELIDNSNEIQILEFMILKKYI